MKQRQLDDTARRQLRKLNIVMLRAGVLFLLGLGGLYLWRLWSFDHAIARIEAVWEEQRRTKDGPKTVTMADLSFERTGRDGRPYACRHAFEVGTPRDGFKVGDRLEIVPATGTCQRIDLIGRATETN
jgi:hypothetical protein